MGCDLNHIAVCGELNNSVSRVCNSLHMFIAAYFFLRNPRRRDNPQPYLWHNLATTQFG